MEIVYEGQGKIINFKEMKDRLKNNPPKVETDQQQQNVKELEDCLNKIILVLDEHNAQIVSIPKMEVIAPGVFRLIGDLLLTVKKG